MAIDSVPSTVRPVVLHRVATAYEERPVVVTGGASFIGSHLVEALVSLGASVTVADDFSSGKLEHLEAVRGRIRIMRGDLREQVFAREAVADASIVFHLAAAHGGRGYIDTHPVECLSNMSLDHVVFSAAADAQSEKMVYASSACVYPTILQADDAERLLLREEEAGFDEPGKAYADGEYGWYKLMGELQLRAFHRQHGLDVIACRIFTAYGERENESHAVIALIAKAIARLDPFPVWGDGRQTRNFTYVGDTVAGLLLAGAFLSGSDVVNVGTPEHVTIDALIDLIFEIDGWHPAQIEHELDRPVGVRSRAADVTRVEKLLDWQPEYSVREGVGRTLDWYRSNATPSRLSQLESLLMTR